MFVRDDDLVTAFIVGLRLTDTESDAVGFGLCVDLVTASLIDLGEALEELDRWGWITLDDEVDVTVLVCLRGERHYINYYVTLHYISITLHHVQ